MIGPVPSISRGTRSAPGRAGRTSRRCLRRRSDRQPPRSTPPNAELTSALATSASTTSPPTSDHQHDGFGRRGQDEEQRADRPPSRSRSGRRRSPSRRCRRSARPRSCFRYAALVFTRLDRADVLDDEHRHHEVGREVPGQADQPDDEPADEPASFRDRAQDHANGGRDQGVAEDVAESRDRAIRNPSATVGSPPRRRMSAAPTSAVLQKKITKVLHDVEQEPEHPAAAAREARLRSRWSRTCRPGRRARRTSPRPSRTARPTRSETRSSSLSARSTAALALTSPQLLESRSNMSFLLFPVDRR